MIFSSAKLDAPSPVSTPDKILTKSEISVEGGMVVMGSDTFRLREVMSAALNKDTVSGDGIGGSAVFTTREFERNNGIIKKTYKATFNEEAISTMDSVIKKLKEAGIVTQTMNLLDTSFRRSFF